MKHFRKRLAAFLLAMTILCSSSAAAASTEDTTSSKSDATIEINTLFDLLMQYVDWYGIDGDNGQVLRSYFDQYFEKHPDEFVTIVNDIMQSMDPYSHYMTKEQYQATYGQLSQSFYGVGITFDDRLRITDVYAEGAAGQAGVHVGDVLLQVDGKNVTGIGFSNVLTLLRGKENTAVTIVVSRGGQELTFTMTRRATTPHHVYSRSLADGVAYVRVAAMGSQEDTDTFVSIWNGFAKNHVRAAILDLRGNGGGLVNMAMKMIETITPKANEKYLSLRYNELSGGLQQFYTPGGGIQLNKLIILTDKNTASAAEIVSGSLSDLHVAELLGEPTYGKGVGQYHIDLGDSVLILTSMELQLPVRGAYNGQPIRPDLYLSLSNQVSDSVSLPGMDTRRLLVPGMKGSTVSAMITRLKLLGYVKETGSTFDVATLEALQQFQKDCGFIAAPFATPQTLAQLDTLAQEKASSLSGIDNQLSAALAICKTAAAQPAQYAVNANGTWNNLNQ